MKIGICPSALKTDALKHVKPIADYLQRNSVKIFIDKEHCSRFDYPPIEESHNIDIILSIGGDGTLLYYRNRYDHFPNLVLTGVNVGTLGFMADIRIEDLDYYLSCLVKKDYTIEKRLTIKADDPGGATHTAVNDFVFHRGNIQSMITLKIKIDGRYFNTFRADGLTISTPTGSTAYSLSAGGPIMSPTISALVITPICPHALTTRPFVVPGASTIEIEYIEHEIPINVSIDGIQTFPLSPGEKTTISVGDKPFQLVSFPHKSDFFATLREKLNWSGTPISEAPNKGF